jgi:single-strand DNA-binding protein
MSGINKAIILGRLGHDPSTRYTADGKVVTNFSLATSFGKGEAEKTEWHLCVAWDKTAEVIDKYVKKGNRLYVEGELQTRKWEDKEGHPRTTTEIRVFKVEFIDRNEETQQDALPKTTGGVAAMDEDLPF